MLPIGKGSLVCGGYWPVLGGGQFDGAHCLGQEAWSSAGGRAVVTQSSKVVWKGGHDCGHGCDLVCRCGRDLS